MTILSASTLSMSSGSSLGSLASSRGSLNTSSRGSLNSLSSTDLYYNQADQPTDLDYQYKLDFILQEKCGYIPSGPITTIHENEVVSSHGRMGYSDSSSSSATSNVPKSTEPPKSVTSLSSRSSLSSLSPPGSPLVLEGAFSVPAQDSPLHHLTRDFEDCDLHSDFAGISLCGNQMLLDSETRESSQSLVHEKDLNESVRQTVSPSKNTGQKEELALRVWKRDVGSSKQGEKQVDTDVERLEERPEDRTVQDRIKIKTNIKHIVRTTNEKKQIITVNPQNLKDQKEQNALPVAKKKAKQVPCMPLQEGVDLTRRTVSRLLEEKAGCVSAAVSDESVAGDSGVYEASVKQPNDSEEVAYSEDDTTVLETAQVEIGLRYDTSSSSFVIIVGCLKNLHALSTSPGFKVTYHKESWITIGAGVKTGRRNINNLRYADDTMLLTAGSSNFEMTPDECERRK
ncbi:Protein WWC2 [Varanus komodoensis]|nr:Protein WWC2 [Varanus komodoensis]